MGLDEYNRKRDFRITREPAGEGPVPARGDGARGFVIQKHAATRLHYDFRLELDGVLLSWSVPKGPSLDPKVKRLAMHVEDHPLTYADFEGIIPKGQYGGGTVLLWDHGTWEPMGDPRRDYAAGNLKFVLKGQKLQGGFALIKLRGRSARRGDRHDDDERSWLLIKERDAQARDEARGDVTALRPDSVTTGRTLEEIAADRERVWHSKTAHVDPSAEPGARPAPLPAKLRPPPIADRPKPPDAAGWLHEIAIDGARLVARNDGDQIGFFDGRGAGLPAARARKLERVAAAVRMLPAHELVVDGVLAEEKPGEVYYLFDLPYLDGHDLTAVPLERRKALLAELVRRASEPGPIRYLDHVATDGPVFARGAAELGVVGMVSRRADSRYDARAGWVRSPTVAAPRKINARR